MMDPSNPFGAMMQQAVKMKGASQATLKTIWDSWPDFYQNSMFAKEGRPQLAESKPSLSVLKYGWFVNIVDLLAARVAEFPEKMAAATAWKEQGNKLVKGSRANYVDATLSYEKALAVFKYLVNTNDKWRNQVELDLA